MPNLEFYSRIHADRMTSRRYEIGARELQEMNIIPIIDIAPFLDGTAKVQVAAARAVEDACSTLGFLIISGARGGRQPHR
jgi:hypothetical protein